MSVTGDGWGVFPAEEAKYTRAQRTAKRHSWSPEWEQGRMWGRIWGRQSLKSLSPRKRGAVGASVWGTVTAVMQLRCGDWVKAEGL